MAIRFIVYSFIIIIFRTSQFLNMELKRDNAVALHGRVKIGNLKALLTLLSLNPGRIAEEKFGENRHRQLF